MKGRPAAAVLRTRRSPLAVARTKPTVKATRSQRDARTARGRPASPMKVTVTERVGLDPRAELLTTGDTDKLVYSGQFLAQHERPWPLDRWTTRSHARLTNPGSYAAAR